MPPEWKYPHIAAAVFASPWAISPAMHETICALIEAREEGHAKDGKDYVWSEPEAYLTGSGVKVVPVRGVMSKRINLVAAMSGGMSTEKVEASIQEAVADEAVRAIVLDIDSPGGTVDGSFALAESVYKARGTKPIVAFVDGRAASAAYLLASACDYVVATEVSDVGSIGVLMTHVDRSGVDKKRGIVRTTIFAGEYKTAGSPHKPLDPKSQAYLQAGVDHVYRMFVRKVAKYRGVSLEQAQGMAGGKEFLGEQALEAGLVDRIGERHVALAEAESRIKKEVTRYDPFLGVRAAVIDGGRIPYDPLTHTERRNDQ